MPFRTFNDWLFDGSRNSPIPRARTDANGKTVDILKYNSPITHTYVISLFLKKPKLNKYLNEYFNDINLRYLSKEELFIFIKKCVIDFKVTRRDIMFYKRQPRVMLYERLREKFPLYKNDDINLLCDIVENSPKREAIYNSLGLEKPQKRKITRTKKEKQTKKISVKNLLGDHFSIMKD